MKNYKKAHYFPLIILSLTLLIAFTVYAHPGKTDSNGGHYNRSTGEYHYHHGYPAHQHTNGICPYDFKDNTDIDSSSATKSLTNIIDDFFDLIFPYVGLYFFSLMMLSIIVAAINSRYPKFEGLLTLLVALLWYPAFFIPIIICILYLISLILSGGKLMIFLYDFMTAISFCIPSLVVVLIISFIMKRQTKFSITIITLCACSFNLIASQFSSSYFIVETLIITILFSFLLLYRKYDRSSPNAEKDKEVPISVVGKKYDTLANSNNEYVATTGDSTTSENDGDAPRKMSTKLKISLSFLLAINLILVCACSYLYYTNQEYKNDVLELRSQSYDLGFQDGVDSILSDGQFVYWDGTAYFHKNNTCPSCDKARLYLRSDRERVGIKPCRICYK